MLNKLKNIDWTRAMFLVPILLVAGISISHVISWYDLANPYSWALYLSVAIEIGAMTSLIAATKKIKGGVWFMFGLVTFIQVVGNIFYCYANIDETDEFFKKWIELTSPIFESMGTDADDIIPHKRWLALLEGGLLPLISLTSLHFYTKYEKDDEGTTIKEEPPKTNPKPNLPKEPTVVKKTTVQEEGENEVVTEVVTEGVNEEPLEDEVIEEESISDEIIEMEEPIQSPDLVEEENPEDEIIVEEVKEEKKDDYEEVVENLKTEVKELPDVVKETQEKFYPNSKKDYEFDSRRKVFTDDGKHTVLTYKRRKR
jgi:hypothetical protein